MRERVSGRGYADRVRAFYDESFAEHGLDHRALGYRRRASQLRRLEILAEVGDLDRRRVLDVGAGLGDLLLLLWERGVAPSYTGLDLSESLTAAARARFRGKARGPWRFLTADVLDHRDPDGYDYVLASGIFGLKTGETAARIRPTLERMFALCRRAVAVNFLSARAARHAEHSLYLEPAAVIEEAWRLTRSVVLRHDYLPNDFALYLYREPNRGNSGRGLPAWKWR